MDQSHTRHKNHITAVRAEFYSPNILHQEGFIIIIININRTPVYHSSKNKNKQNISSSEDGGGRDMHLPPQITSKNTLFHSKENRLYIPPKKPPKKQQHSVKMFTIDFIHPSKIKIIIIFKFEIQLKILHNKCKLLIELHFTTTVKKKEE